MRLFLNLLIHQIRGHFANGWLLLSFFYFVILIEPLHLMLFGVNFGESSYFFINIEGVFFEWGLEVVFFNLTLILFFPQVNLPLYVWEGTDIGGLGIWSGWNRGLNSWVIGTVDDIFEVHVLADEILCCEVVDAREWKDKMLGRTHCGRK